MPRQNGLLYLWLMPAWLLLGCAAYQPSQKIAPAQLQQDLDVAWKTYRAVHPSYDWYTPSDSVDAAFARVRASLTDSLAEPEFRLRLSYALASIRCGHTSVRASKGYARYAANRKEPALPFEAQVVSGDSLVVRMTRVGAASLQKGDIILAIDEVPATTLLNQMRRYISTDGYNNTFKDAAISYGFSARFRLLYGLKEQYRIDYLDSLGMPRQTTVALFRPKPDSTRKKSAVSPLPKAGGIGKKRVVTAPNKQLYLDSGETVATMVLDKFSGRHARRFYRHAFKLLHQKGISSLVLDVSENTGGQISQYVQLTRYLVSKPFGVADSVSARSFAFPYPKRVQAAWYYRTLNHLMVHRKADGRWHMGANERTKYTPQRKYGYKGQVYALTGGFSFSATTLLLNALKDQENVLRIGEETGGGARGNSAVNTPNLTLPNSHIRLRLPLYRLVTDHKLPHNGRGLMPHIPAVHTSYTIRHGIRPDMQMANMLIRKQMTQNSTRQP